MGVRYPNEPNMSSKKEVYTINQTSITNISYYLFYVSRELDKSTNLFFSSYLNEFLIYFLLYGNIVYGRYALVFIWGRIYSRKNALICLTEGRAPVHPESVPACGHGVTMKPAKAVVWILFAFTWESKR